MNQYRDLVNKLEAIQNRVNEGELDRMAAQGSADQLPPGYTRTPQGQILAPNLAGQAQAAGDAQDQADMQRLSNYTFQQATKNSPKRISNAQAAQQANQLDKVQEEGEGSNEPTMSATDQLLVGEKSVEECGMPMSSPKQSDNVTMNVTAQGAGGIRDLMNLLRSIEQSNSDDHPVLAKIGGMEEDQVDGGFRSATTEPDEQTAGIDAVTSTGNDLASKGAEAPKVNGGGNPFVKEGLLAELNSLYQEVKLR